MDTSSRRSEIPTGPNVRRCGDRIRNCWPSSTPVSMACWTASAICTLPTDAGSPDHRRICRHRARQPEPRTPSPRRRARRKSPMRTRLPSPVQGPHSGCLLCRSGRVHRLVGRTANEWFRASDPPWRIDRFGRRPELNAVVVGVSRGPAREPDPVHALCADTELLRRDSAGDARQPDGALAGHRGLHHSRPTVGVRRWVLVVGLEPDRVVPVDGTAVEPAVARAGDRSALLRVHRILAEQSAHPRTAACRTGASRSRKVLYSGR